MYNYSTLAKKLIQESRVYEDSLPLMDETCRSRFFLHPTPSQKVCVFFHGFTATPEQFVPIGQAFFQAGYNVIIPLLPGHGIAGTWNADTPPPLPESEEIYKYFGLNWLEKVQALGKQVVVGGLSGGSTLAAWLALECPQEIYRSLVFAPYLSCAQKVIDLVVRNLNIYFEWKTDPEVKHFGYDGFFMPALRVFLDMGQEVLERAANSLSAPMLIVSSESDRAVSSKDHEALYKAVLKYQPKSHYYRFDQALNIGHNMMTKAEGNEYIDLLIALAKAYVDTDLALSKASLISQEFNKISSFVN